MSEKDALYEALRDQLARILHDWDHGTQENDSPTEPCWLAYRVEADLLMPAIRPHLVTAWNAGASEGLRTPAHLGWALRNPYLDHGARCTCSFCRVAAMGGGR